MQVKIVKNIGHWNFNRRFDNKMFSVHNFLSYLENYRNTIMLSEEHCDSKWIMPHDIVNYELNDISLSDNILKSLDTIVKVRRHERSMHR